MIARGFAWRRLITSAATAIDVLQLGAGEFTHDRSPPMSQPYDKYELAVSLSVFALQGFAPKKGANSIFGFRENCGQKGTLSTGIGAPFLCRCNQTDRAGIAAAAKAGMRARSMRRYGRRTSVSGVAERYSFANVLWLRNVLVPGFGRKQSGPDHSCVFWFHVLAHLSLPSLTIRTGRLNPGGFSSSGTLGLSRNPG